MKTINKNTSTQRPVFSGKTLKTKFQNYTCKQVKTGLNTGFTLVELIIVITILAILATIAFTSFQNFTKDARDGNRVSTIKSIESGLELYTIKTGNYPQPEGEISTGTINDQPLSYKGVIGETIGKQININKTPIDPLTEKNYVYGITANKRQYQIASILEGDMAYQSLIPTTYANSYYSKVSGNYKGFLTYSSGSETWIANIPSLIYNFTGTTNLLSTTGAYFIIHKGTNLPYAPNPQTQINHKALEATIQEKTNKSEAKLINISKNALMQFLSGGTLPAGTSTGELFSSFGVETKESLEVLITGASSQVVPSPTPPVEDQTPAEEPTPLTCEIDEYSENGTTCVSVGTGYYSADGETTRTACSNKPENNSEYTGMGNGTNNCSFSCTGSYIGASCDIQPLGTIGTVTYTGGTVYTYTTKVMPMKTSDNTEYSAIWTTQNMRHPVDVGGNNCLTTTWTSTDTGKCSVGHQTNNVVGYDDTTTQTNLYGMYYQWSAAKEVCKLLGDGWDLASNEKFMDLERGLGCTDPSPTGTWNRCGNSYGGFPSGTNGLGYTASSTESVRYMGGVFGNNSTSLPGFRNIDGAFDDRGSNGLWWSDTGGGSAASNRDLVSSYSTVLLNANNPASGFSVVCFKN